jgi:hypothetical protein
LFSYFFCWPRLPSFTFQKSRDCNFLSSLSFILSPVISVTNNAPRVLHWSLKKRGCSFIFCV